MTLRLAVIASVLLFFLAAVPTPAAADAVVAREYLSQAQTAAAEIELVGDQSLVLQQVASALAVFDAQAALDLAARIRRPSDAARVLGAASLTVVRSNPEGAAQDIITAGRLLLRITDPDQRLAEQRLLLREIAPLQVIALPAGPELSPGEAQLEVVLGLAPTDPTAAYSLIRKWQLANAAGDRALAVVADRLAWQSPTLAVEAALSITSEKTRDAALWRIATQRPPAEAEGMITLVADPLIKSALATDAAMRMIPVDSAAATQVAATIEVAPASAQAQLAVTLAATDREQALALARALPAEPRRWALANIAVQLAPSDCDLMGKLLAEAGASPTAQALAVITVSATDTGQAFELARGLPAGPAKEAALLAVVEASLPADPTRAKDVLWDMAPSPWRSQAVAAIAVSLAPQELDAATGLLGMVGDPSEISRIRGALAEVIAGRNPDQAESLLQALPLSPYRTESALRAGIAALAAGGTPARALAIASLGMPRDLAIRWMAPALARLRTRSAADMIGQTTTPFIRALASLDIARDLLGTKPRPTPRPDLAAMIRPIVEWETR